MTPTAAVRRQDIVFALYHLALDRLYDLAVKRGQ